MSAECKPLCLIMAITVFLLSCSNKSNRLADNDFEILPGTFTAKDISLFEIAEDLEIIPISNEMPIPSIRFITWYDSVFYIAHKAQGKIYRFSQDGKYIDVLDKQGRGEGEYQYIVDFFVDSSTGNIYVSTSVNKIVVYDNNFNHLRDIKYPQKRDGSIRSLWLDGYIHIFYFNDTGKGYGWFRIDSIGNVMDSRPCVDTYKTPAYTYAIQLFYNNNKLYRYFDYNDTIYEIDSEGYRPYKIVNRTFSDGYDDVYLEGKSQADPGRNISSRRIRSIFGIGDYWMINYIKYKNSSKYKLEETVLYDYTNDISYIVNTFEPSKELPFSIGLFNDWVGSGTIYPKAILEMNGSRYILHSVAAIDFLNYVNSESFVEGIPCRPELKQKLERIADTLTIEDNPVMILLKLK